MGIFLSRDLREPGAPGLLQSAPFMSSFPQGGVQPHLLGLGGKVFVVGVCKDLGQLLVRHVGQLSEVQEIEVDLQRGDTAQRL